MRKLVDILKQPKLDKSLVQNVACCLGRVVNLYPTALANEDLEKILKNWCISLMYIKSKEEKISAYRGFCKVAPNSLEAIRKEFPFMCSSFNKFKYPPPDLEDTFKQILAAFKEKVVSQSQEQWNSYLRTFPESLVNDLQNRFEI